MYVPLYQVHSTEASETEFANDVACYFLGTCVWWGNVGMYFIFGDRGGVGSAGGMGVWILSGSRWVGMTSLDMGNNLVCFSDSREWKLKSFDA